MIEACDMIEVCDISHSPTDTHTLMLMQTHLTRMNIYLCVNNDLIAHDLLLVSLHSIHTTAAKTNCSLHVSAGQSP